jgi:3-hydroxyisobutyrate dehydrogenase
LKIGFVGLGRMGGRLASRLTEVGELTVYDASERAMAPFTGRAALGSSIADAGIDTDVVGICVRTGPQVNECVDALLPVMKRGSVLMIHSTVSPEVVKTAAKRGEAYEVDVIDAPVTVTRYDGADAPFVFVMIGGEPHVGARTRPLLDAYATDTIHVGPLGSGMSLKIINNLVSLVEITVAEEAFRLAGLTAVPAEALKTVMGRNGALTPTMMAIASRAGQPPADRETMAQREVQASNGVKDLALAEELAKSVDTASATATFAKTQYWFAYTANVR